MHDRVDSALLSNPTLLSALLDAASAQHYLIQKGLKGSNKTFNVTEDTNHTCLFKHWNTGAWRQKRGGEVAAQVRDVQKLVMELEDMVVLVLVRLISA